jgi:hypothetical protein
MRLRVQNVAMISRLILNTNKERSAMSNWNKRHGIKNWDQIKNKVPDQGHGQMSITEIKVLSLLIAVFFLIAGIFVGLEIMERAAIEHNAAFYHPKTGAFTWKENKDADK